MWFLWQKKNNSKYVFFFYRINRCHWLHTYKDPRRRSLQQTTDNSDQVILLLLFITRMLFFFFIILHDSDLALWHTHTNFIYQKKTFVSGNILLSNPNMKAKKGPFLYIINKFKQIDIKIYQLLDTFLSSALSQHHIIIWLFKLKNREVALLYSN